MPFWKQEELQQLMSQASREQLFDAAVSLAHQLDMKYLAFSVRSRYATLNPYMVMFNNYPAEWNAHYAREGYSLVDPTIAHCRLSLMPVLWDDELFRASPQLRNDAKAFGLCHGWSQSAQDARGNESILSVARPEEPVELHEFYEKVGQTSWLCNLMHSLTLDLLHPQDASVPQLSEREKEVLDWTAAGKTASEIATILKLSESTVNFHIRNFTTKLGKTNKTSAVAAAARIGLL